MNEGTPISSAISLAKIPPRLEACCPETPTSKSFTSASVHAYVPPGIGLSIPPLPTTIPKLLTSNSFDLRRSIIIFFLKSF